MTANKLDVSSSNTQHSIYKRYLLNIYMNNLEILIIKDCAFYNQKD